MPKRATSSKKSVNQPKPDFHRQTVLFQWAMRKLGVSDLEEFKKVYQINADTATGLNPANGLHHFYQSIVNSIYTRGELTLPESRLTEYEQNLRDITQQINTNRLHHGQPIVVWKYYQYLTLLLTELFLDEYFNNPESLRRELNTRIAEHNKEAIDGDKVTPFDEQGVQTATEQLSKLAFWSATGSGKTLMMHVNLLQFRHYHGLAHQRGKWPALDQIILVTPNVGLTRQHIQELNWSGLEAMELAEEATPDLLSPQVRKAIKVIDIHKLITEQEVHARASRAAGVSKPTVSLRGRCAVAI